jgi:hypothetical protein
MKNPLQHINNTSLAKIHFFNSSFEKLMEELEFYNIIFAGNGVFIVLKTAFGLSTSKIDSIKYTNTALTKLDTNVSFYSFIPKPDIRIFERIIEIFKYVYDKIKSEIGVNVYYNKRNGTFHININQQLVTEVKIEYEYNKKFEMSNDYVRYLQIHSHNSMPANFSGVDNQDETCKTPCYYGVVGKLNSKSSIYTIESSFRIWDGIKFHKISLDDIFNIQPPSQKLSNVELNNLNKIIENSTKVSSSNSFEDKILKEIELI